MLYISTRNRPYVEAAEPKDFEEVLLEGLAPDGGLYVPEHYPVFTGAELDMLRGKSYIELATHVLWKFSSGMHLKTIREIVAHTYRPEIFGTSNITPLKKLEDGLYLLKLSEGPTLAFKDVPLQLLGNLMEYVLKKKGEVLNLCGATSGDTGSAAEYTVRGKKNMNIFMLSPYGRMSRFQQRQMYTLNEPNIFNLAVNGTFDDCQAMVKEVNADAEFKKKYKLGAVNSINWARIAAQVVYYVYAYLEVSAGSNHQSVSFAVPSGNFGNALAAHVARKMGVPIHTIFVCTNENDVLHEFFASGVYRVRKKSEVKMTSSPSMDITEASNFERYIFDLVGRNPQAIHNLWDKVKRGLPFSVGTSREFIEERMFKMCSGKASNAAVLDTIRLVHQRYATIIDPHTAVAMKVALEMGNLPNYKGIPIIVAETAQPAKFADTIREALGFEAPVPMAYEKLDALPEYVTKIDPDARLVKRFIEAHVSL